MLSDAFHTVENHVCLCSIAMHILQQKLFCVCTLFTRTFNPEVYAFSHVYVFQFAECPL